MDKDKQLKEIQMACHICKVTKIRTCDPEEADIKCSVCGYCAAQELLKKGESE